MGFNKYKFHYYNARDARSGCKFFLFSCHEYSDYGILLIVKMAYHWRFENEIYDTCAEIKCAEIKVKYDLNVICVLLLLSASSELLCFSIVIALEIN